MADPGYDADVDRLDAALIVEDWNQHLRLRLPAELESAYREHQSRQAVMRFRRAVLLLAALWLLLGSAIGWLLPAGAQPLWQELCGSVGLAVAVMAVLAQIRALDIWFPAYASLGGGLVVALSLAATALQHDTGCIQLTQAGMILGVLSLYCLTGLRLGQAWPASLAGAAAGMALARAQGGQGGPWLQVLFASNLLGMFLAFCNDHRGRAFFLQLRQIEQITHEDPLTGMPNRRHGDIALRREWRRALREQRPLAVVLVDLDHFKDYVRSHGQEQGNRTLQEVADIVSRYARRPGDVAARSGAGEFLLLLPDMLPETANTVAEKLLEDIREARLQLSGQAVSASIGVAVAVPFSDWQPQWLLDAASRAVHEARHAGGDGWRHGPFRVNVELLALG